MFNNNGGRETKHASLKGTVSTFRATANAKKLLLSETVFVEFYPKKSKYNGYTAF